jgi:hypothetical protein
MLEYEANVKWNYNSPKLPMNKCEVKFMMQQYSEQLLSYEVV